MKRTGLSRAPIAAAAVLAAVLTTQPAIARATPSPPAPTGPGSTTAAPAVRHGAPKPTHSVLIVHVAGNAAALRTAIAHSPVAVRHTFGSLHAFSVQVPSDAASAESARLDALPGVSSVEAPVTREFDDPATDTPSTDTPSTDTPSADTPSADYPATDDPDLPKQEPYLDAVHAPAAWTEQHGSPAIKIAIVDSGVDVAHPDLAAKIVGTYNAVDNSTDVTDAVGHGTFVAGVAAADTNNGVGVAGAGYDADLLAVKIAGPDGSIQIDDEVKGIDWAVDHGANIINLSLGGPDSSAAERSAIAAAQAKGILVVAAAGNEANSVKQYPAAYPGVVAVGATDSASGKRAGFSSYGSWVTLAAPGVGIYSTVPTGGSTFWPGTGDYAAGDGTSFSTPLVAGEAALLEAQNPTLSVTKLRAALVASAHGYSGLGLGAGQVDFSHALAHVAPTTTPTAVHVNGTAGRVTLVASSTAAQVSFKVGTAPVRAPVPVVGGQATSRISTWGFRNGPQTLSAYDCSAYGECNTTPSVVSFPVINPASTLTTPRAGATVTGRFPVTAANPAGGSLRLLLDGRPTGLIAAAPYVFTYSASDLSDGKHTLATQGCSTDGLHCQGPTSPTVTVTAAGLHPRITGLSPAHISPNGDGVRDTGTLTFRLPQPERVHIDTLTAAGTVVRSAGLGVLPAGAHTWTWRAQRDGGARLPDGTYTLAVASAADGRRGWVIHTGVIDTVAPRLTRPTGANTAFYPVLDGYRDTFTTHTRLSDAGTLTLTVRTLTGRVVRVVRAARPKGAAAISWTGRDAGKHLVPAGTYRWQLSITDTSGNTRRSAQYPVRLFHKRLVRQSRFIVKHGAKYDFAGGTASCASARRSTSAFALGVHLVNRCSTADFDLAYAQYTFAVSPAVRYTTISIQVRGRSTNRPSELSAAFQTTEGDVEIPGYREITNSGTAWHTIASVPATGHVTAGHRVHVSVLLDSNFASTNDFDVDDARLRVTVVALR